MVDVYLNQKFIGTVENGKIFVDNFRNERRKGKIPEFLNISYNDKYNEIYMDSSKGRARRPLIIVKDGKSLVTNEHIDKLKNNKFTWNDLVDSGVIE